MRSNHSRVMWVCAALMALVVVLVIAGTFDAWYLLAVIPCALMMGAMAWMMIGMARGGHGGHGGGA